MRYNFIFKTSYKSLVVLLISGIVFVSCGFHLRGEISVPEVMKDLYVSGDYSSNDLGKVLFRRFQQLGISKIVKKENASAVLSITRNSFTRRVLTVDAATKASAYKLDLVIGFQVIDKEGVVIIKNQQIRQTREYNVDASNALASGDQEIRLRIEMIEFIVNQMLTRISIVLKSRS